MMNHEETLENQPIRYTMEEWKEFATHRKDFYLGLIIGMILAVIPFPFVPSELMRSVGRRVYVPKEYYVIFIWFLGYCYFLAFRLRQVPEPLRQLDGKVWKRINKDVKASFTYWIHLLSMAIWVGLFIYMLNAFQAYVPK